MQQKYIRVYKLQEIENILTKIALYYLRMLIALKNYLMPLKLFLINNENRNIPTPTFS